MSDKTYKIVVYVPEDHADEVREALGKVGAGKVGDYSHVSFSVKGKARFKPEPGADPNNGEIGKIEVVDEERIETVCDADKLQEVIKAVKDAHPDEEPALDVYPIEKV